MTGDNHVAVIEIDSSVEFKIRSKHHITGDVVREALLAGDCRRAWEYDEANGGWRLVCLGTSADGRHVIGVLLLIDRDAGHYKLKTGRYV